MTTRAEALRQAQASFGDAEIGDPAADARLLLLAATGLSPLDLVASGRTPLAAEEEARFAAYVARRLGGEPAGRILGRRSFWGLDFALGPETLEPRDDSETVIEEAMARLGARRSEPLSFLDLGAGTGCLLIALLSECGRATGLGVDVSAGALETARVNAETNDVGGRARFLLTSWTEGVEEEFDLIVSNPPYIAEAEIDALEIEVRAHDPRRALDGGPDGLDAYRAIFPAMAGRLRPGGLAVVEIGAGQEQAVLALASQAGFRDFSARRDLGGHVRAIGMAWPGPSGLGESRP
jgi:release factor glutamine methyltransferase